MVVGVELLESPGAAVGARLAQRISAARLRAAFGTMLIGFSIFFLVRQLG